MGYRFQLDTVAHPSAVSRGGTITVQVALRNLGSFTGFSLDQLLEGKGTAPDPIP